MGQNMLFEAHLIIHACILLFEAHLIIHACILALKQSLLTLFNSTYAYVFLFLRSVHASIQDLFMPLMIPRMVSVWNGYSWSTRASNVLNIFKVEALVLRMFETFLRFFRCVHSLWGFHAWNQNEMITFEALMLRMFLFTFLACSYQWFQSLNHHNLMTVRHSCITSSLC